MMDRLPPIPPAAWTAGQREHAERIINGPRGALLPPFIPLMRSPELMGHAQRMGEYLRYHSALPRRLTELAILLVAREWTQQVEWAIHAPLAIEAGISPSAVDDLAAGRTPTFPDDDCRLVHDFCRQLQTTKSVSDTVWNAAITKLGERAVVDLLGTVGYYTFLSMVMDAAQTPPPPSSVPRLACKRSPIGVLPCL
ncbi:MAG: carboxymuconolactone decarboxylase family protein [Burkholderiales bacterium]|nr:carboxymuconolactone decarboxylase family protein [Burkholderiales bacterium]